MSAEFFLPNSADKCVGRMIDVLKLEGVAAGRPILQRLLLEPDTLAQIRAKGLEKLVFLIRVAECISIADKRIRARYDVMA